MVSIPKVWGIIRARARSWCSEFRTIPFFFQLAALGAVIIQALGPYMRKAGRAWWSWQSWRAGIADACFVLGAVLYLRYEEKFRKYFNKRKLEHKWKARMARLARIIDTLKYPDQRKTQAIEECRREILVCVAEGIAEILHIPPESICANLLSLCAGKKQMEVSARSDPIRNLKRYEAVDAFLPWRAIATGKIEVEHDYHEREGLGPRSYRSIIVMPVTRNDRAYGSLSIDCTVAYAFYGHEPRIAFQVRPYLSLLALTYGDSSPYHECAFDPAHAG